MPLIHSPLGDYLTGVDALRPSKRMHALHMRVRKQIDLSSEAC
jgi:hypothetical protein